MYNVAYSKEKSMSSYEESLIEKENELINNLETRKMEDYWNKALPSFNPRPSQKHIMNWINNLPSNIKYIMCEMPVGGGKSPLALAYSSYINNGMGNSFILTPQKTLQKQYEESFDSKIISSIYGRSNYTCEPKNTDCDTGGNIKPVCELCPAKVARDIALSSPNMILNYSIALTYFKYLRNRINPRDLIVFDECHTLESHLVEFSSINVSENKCKQYNVKFKKPKNVDDALNWLNNNYLKAVESKAYKLRQKIKAMDDRSNLKLSKSDITTIKLYKSTTEHIEQLTELLSMDRELIEKVYVLVSDKTFFKFKELYGKNNFKNLVYPKANRFLFMSSTILDKEGFCNDLGINPKESAMISVDSEFNVKNREVIFKPVTKMNYGWNKPERTNDRKKMISVINHVLEHHSNQSGIIHTGSFQIASWLVENIKSEHEIVHHNPDIDVSRDDAIDYYLNNAEHKPLLLISPSITEGMDLNNDRGRFALIAKVPYPYLGDAWIKRRMELSKNWYNRQTITGIIQGCGRVVRSSNDWGHVYILDGSFEYLYNQTSNIIPKWWKDGLIVL